MSIKDYMEKVKSALKPFYTLFLILILGSIFSALGRLSAIENRRTPIKIEYGKIAQTGTVIGGLEANSSQNVTVPELNSGGGVIGSAGSKKYYFPWCGTVKRIKPENQVQFASIEAARAAGYLPGGNCKGLE